MTLPDGRSAGALKAWATRRTARYKANKSEQASKAALLAWCRSNEWRVLFFEGATGAPRTGIVDAVLVRIKPGAADAIEIRLVQLKAGSGGLTAREIARLKQAVTSISTDWLLAAFDGQTLHFLPVLESKITSKRSNKGLALGAHKDARP
ncbi:MAG: hypothetical protein ACHQ9S_09890 [Candidatus Binatia bacterium]